MIVRKRNLYITFFLCTVSLFVAKSQQNFGLEFNSFNVPQENRTTLYIGDKKPLQFKNNSDVEISFDLSFLPNYNIYFGYIMRVVNTTGQSINLLYDYGRKKFKVIIDNKYIGINFSIADDALFNGWTNLKFEINKNVLSLFINNKPVAKVNYVINNYNFKLIYGVGNDGVFNTTDVPPMVIRNVSISENNKEKYSWSLRYADSSNIVYDSVSNLPAKVVNPIWSSVLHTQWSLLQSFTFKGNAGISFDNKNEILYGVADDSVYKISLKGDTVNTESFSSLDHKLYPGSYSFYNPVDQKLYNYYIDARKVAEYSFASKNWNIKFDKADYTNYSQASRVFVPQENALYMFGGYGHFKYKDKIQRYLFKDKKWDTLIAAGDKFTPRYWSASASTGDYIYILGGYGSSTGDQMINPDYIYDFLQYNTKTQTFKKIYSLPKNSDSSMLFGGSMIIDSADQCYYTFRFSNVRKQSQLQLIKGSLTKPVVQALATPIPFDFHDILSEVNLFYCPSSNRMIVTTSYRHLDKDYKINIYSIAYPPDVVTEEALVANTKQSTLNNKLIYLLGILFCVLIISAIIFYYIKRKNKKIILTDNDKKILPVPEESFAEYTIANNISAISEEKNKLAQSIYLFGNFEVLDKSGKDISPNFSPLLKELFLIVLLNSIYTQKGISSEKLNEIFWHNKSDKDANNNRSVNIVKLKNFLEKIGDITIKKAPVKWKIEYNPNDVTIDLNTFLQASSTKQDNIYEKTNIMLSVLSRGSFLSQTDYDWLDDIKSDISNRVIDELLETREYLDPIKDADLLIKVANTIFYFDPVNEEALRLKCGSLVNIGRHSLAMNSYEHFSKEYQKMYGEEYSLSFNDIIFRSS